MPTTTYGNSYTFAITGSFQPYVSVTSAIEKSALEVIQYLSRYVDWQGTMDFVVEFDAPKGNGLLPSYQAVIYVPAQNHFAPTSLREALTGIEETNSEGAFYDAGTNIEPSAAAGNPLLNRGTPLWFGDDSEFPYRDPPDGFHDFASIFLHEIVHAFGVNAGDVDNQNDTFYDDFISYSTPQPTFTGAKTMAANGGSPLVFDGNQPDHYSGPGRGLMFNIGNYDQNAWSLGRLDLALLEDLGWSVRNANELPLVEQDGAVPKAETTGSNSNQFEIYRFFNTETKSHFYTSNVAERESLKQGDNNFIFEGNVFDSDATDTDGLAVFRFFNTQTGTHFYTSDPDERASINAMLPQFQDEGFVYYASAEASGGKQGLHRFYNSENGTHFYTASNSEQQSVAENLPQYQYEGIAYYIDLA